jgi:outer membrane protein insertion porin family
MFSLRGFAVLVLVLLPAGSGLVAQSYPVKSITFSGVPSFTPAELLTASGLSTAAPIDQAGMQAAAQRLDATGMFATIKFKFDGRELHYDLTPSTELLPAHFSNFPWWDTKEISDKLVSTVPLFHGRVALDSGTQQKVIDALTEMLAARQVEAKITATPEVDRGSGKSTGLEFRVTSPPVQIGDVTFSGNNSAWTARLAEIGTAAAGQEYSTLETPTTLSQAVENIYREQGYLEARVSSVTRQPPSIQAGAVRVPMVVAVEEGVQYRLGQFTLAGSVLMDQAEFLGKATLKPGDVVDPAKLRRTMQMLSSPYVTRGYLRAKIVATPSLHPAEQKADYAIAVTPGDVYKMGRLEIKDLDPELTALVLKNWKLDEGAAYDASYPALFLKKNAKDLHPLDGYSASYKQYEHEDTHVVDLVVTFRRGGPVS